MERSTNNISGISYPLKAVYMFLHESKGFQSQHSPALNIAHTFHPQILRRRCISHIAFAPTKDTEDDLHEMGLPKQEGKLSITIRKLYHA